MRSRAADPAGSPRDKDLNWSPVDNPAVRELLDHLADELAREYIRLMKQAVAGTADKVPQKGGHGE